MTMYISPSRPVTEIQNEFNQAYPYLMLGFFLKNQKSRKIGEEEISLNLKTIRDCQSHPFTGSLEFYDSMPVSELEKILADKFYLQAQVFRRAGKHWMQTTITNNWSLAKQNEHGRDITAASGEYAGNNQ